MAGVPCAPYLAPQLKTYDGARQVVASRLAEDNAFGGMDSTRELNVYTSLQRGAGCNSKS